jgi:hypothetical protein
MYESEHNARIIQLAYRLQHEMARGYKPDPVAIRAICQEIENSAHEIYKWAVGIESEV